MAHLSEEEWSDDEVFFGKLTLKKIKKLIFFENRSQSNTFDTLSLSKKDNTSIKIVETHSQPNLRTITVNSPKYSSAPGSPARNNKKTDENFLQMDNVVSKLSLSPRKAEHLELNNTFEIIDYILNNGPNQKTNKTDAEKVVELDKISHLNPLPYTSTKKDFTPRQALPQKNKHQVDKLCAHDSAKYSTPFNIAKRLHQADGFATPSSANLKAKTPLFRTPANPLLHNKATASSSKKTPSKTKAYQHIASPIASYIKKSPQVPLVKDVFPRKPLPGSSFIPVLVKNPCKVYDKENVNLPAVAYKSAKKTKVVTVPDEEKLPQSQWAQKIMSTLTQPTVMKHVNREIDFINKPLPNEKLLEESFANLSCVQADVSLCTQKSAFKTNKH